MSTLDQPQYALAKSLQWHLPEESGPSEYVLMLGSLHIEMVMVSTIGDWVDEGGWLELLANANVTGQGNNSLLTGKVVAKSKYCHQVTAVVLHRLMRFAYEDNKHNIEMDLLNGGYIQKENLHCFSTGQLH